ncbi:hypothetical protein [Roseovarius nanhaiticus]|uniref:hypothetical protein n=1 Tax=Roseovarius nanhaiticus TaxID=573024 RepID=UPI0011144F2A|nr:hypothetical protein [Roseovarius nanhaiticus]
MAPQLHRIDHSSILQHFRSMQASGADESGNSFMAKAILSWQQELAVFSGMSVAALEPIGALHCLESGAFSEQSLLMRHPYFL